MFSSDPAPAGGATNANPAAGSNGMPLPAVALGAAMPGDPSAVASVVDMAEALRFDVTPAWVLGAGRA